MKTWHLDVNRHLDVNQQQFGCWHMIGLGLDTSTGFFFFTS